MEINMKLGDKLFDLKVKYWIFESDFKTKINKILHCNRGYHKIQPNFIKSVSKKPNKRQRTLIDIQFFRCLNCGTLFFLTTKDKEKYLRYQKKNSFGYFEKKLK